MSNILLLETSTDVCSVGISKDGICIAEKTSTKAYTHSKLLTVFIEDCLEQAQIEIKELDAIALSIGPGSYTGLRVGASTAKGLGYGLDIPIIAVSTLHSLAFAFKKTAYDLIVPMIDARRMEVYCQFIDASMQIVKSDFNQILTEEYVENSFSDYKDVVFCGNGAFKLEELIEPFDHLNLVSSECNVKNMVELAHLHFAQAEFVDLAYFEPFYLKGANVTIPKKSVLLR